MTEQLEDVMRVEIQEPVERAALEGHGESLPLGRLLVIAELHGEVEHPDRQPQLVVLGEVDEVRLGHGPALEDLRQGEIRLLDLHPDPRFPCAIV
ncbi:hypothetical protein NHN26_16655 [Rhodovulum tesquicola]|uniref:hypothetical protein n=1 Tax=Rhodovulum tesquicola TaxID=540254 RepID=UPI002097A7DE|nr:hypothetical protein [Rhodovulum tesquicola]MCO8146839.1 hypothetical protein [Rhodovulum tesquicola]